MAVKSIFLDPSRCIGCRACEAACRECDTHKGESMIMVDFIDRGTSVATQPTLCMHCEDPVAPCAQVCPVMAILITPDGVVQQAEPSRCIGCRNCVYACPFGVPKFDIEARLMKKCNLCYDRTSQGLQPWCAQACPTQAIWYGDYQEFINQREGRAVEVTSFGPQSVRTKNYHVVPADEPRLDVTLLLMEADGRVVQTGGADEEAWVL
ncbi:MAG TPA: 4Fe-4S binding protein [Thermomicrobiales bacterium]|nr:4Fe-4S ferredoxin [Chloroflexota bacterium]HQX62117.1 4Fe-4S binding protein [Thermomicrobiales bacterium]HBY44754.1 4Fe-4S ferredoxin [Chloroflexota bacterium]HCG28930.1 4Fe-4S ferredoxin [Chloroflexota bacterium]HQZ90030.1 4Fe-4S binding protein [Thermomicrobiales bacterium]